MIEYPVAGSAPFTFVLHTGLPLYASMAMSRPSIVAHEQRVAENREPAIHDSTAKPCRGRCLIGVVPEDPACSRIQRQHVVWRLCEVHPAIDHKRS